MKSIRPVQLWTLWTLAGVSYGVVILLQGLPVDRLFPGLGIIMLVLLFPLIATPGFIGDKHWRIGWRAAKFVTIFTAAALGVYIGADIDVLWVLLIGYALLFVLSWRTARGGRSSDSLIYNP